MNLFQQLLGYYKPETAVDAAVQRYITGLEVKSDDYKQALFDAVAESRPVKYGFPDIAAIKKAIGEERTCNADASHKKYLWSVCDRCGAVYSIDMAFCPTCFADGGRKFSRRSVGVSETKAPDSIIRYNLTSPVVQVVQGKNCYKCESKMQSFCFYFGKINHNCNSHDWEVCPCRQCCILAKKQNETIEQRRKEALINDMDR